MSLGSGADANIVGLLMTDICGHGDHIPRHARSYADRNWLYAHIEEEKRRALAEFRADVLDGSFPSVTESIVAPESDVERFIEMLES